MKAFSFIHAADLHLDSPFKGISEVSEEIGSELTESTFRAFRKIVDVCLEKPVDFLLIAGDIYDGADKSLRAQLRFRQGLKRLAEAGISVYIVHGNHDPLEGWSAKLDWPQNVHIFKGKSVEPVSVEKGGEEIARIWGISFPRREITTNLARKFPKISPAQEEVFTIAMLHGNLGTNSGHEPYAPCTLKDLVARNFDYWALGHIHQRAVVNDRHPLVVYPGNPQGLHPRETGAKGCFLVKVDEKGAAAGEFVAVDSLRWFGEELSINSLYSEEELISALSERVEKVRRLAGGRPSIGRIVLKGRSPLHSSLARKGVLEDILKDVREREEGERQFVWVESLVDNTGPEVDRQSLLGRKDFIGDLLRLFEECYQDKNKIATLQESLAPLFASPGGRRFLQPLPVEDLLEVIKKAETLCLDKLLGNQYS